MSSLPSPLEESFVAPAPETLFTVPSRTMEALHFAMGYGNVIQGWAEVTDSDVSILRLGETHSRVQFSEILEAGKDAWQQASEYLGQKVVRLELDNRHVAPRDVQRISTWHRDIMGPKNPNILLISDKLPTEFAVGEVHSGDLDEKNYFGARSGQEGPVSRAVAQGLLSVVSSEPYVVQALTQEVIHRSATNNTDEPIDKLLIRIR